MLLGFGVHQLGFSNARTHTPVWSCLTQRTGKAEFSVGTYYNNEYCDCSTELLN